MILSGEAIFQKEFSVQEVMKVVPLEITGGKFTKCILFPYLIANYFIKKHAYF